MSTFKYIYSEEHQALLDQMQEHLNSYTDMLMKNITKEYGEDNCRGQGKGEQLMRNAFLSDPGRQNILDKLLRLQLIMIPVRNEFKELGGDV